MKKKSLTLLLATTVAGSILFSSCIGSFNLTNKLLSWNKEIDSKFVNELVFIAFHIVPVYEIAVLADILVINSIEFWSGKNPVAEASNIRSVETENGVYLVEIKADGYSIRKEGEDQAVEFLFDEVENSWSLELNGESHKFLKYTDGNEVVMYLPDGQEMTVEASPAGVLAFQQVANGYAYLAAR
ncbi:MAG: DUF3332 domain-containing protein [Tannerellaceae bacterium]|nr:DUF3332 domain-containing protein [Tannerellaceae bacterium]